MESNTSTTRRLGALVAALVATVALRFRRRRRRASRSVIATGVDTAAMPAGSTGSHDMADAGSDRAHAPGHRHLEPPPTSRPRRRPASWPRRADKNGHPPRF